MNKILTALELERDTIQYGDLDIPAMDAYIKHPADPDSSNPAGLYVAAANVYLNSTSKIVRKTAERIRLRDVRPANRSETEK